MIAIRMVRRKAEAGPAVLWQILRVVRKEMIRAQAKAIFQGECDIAIMNHYYYGKMLKSDKMAQRDWANAINIVFGKSGGR